MTEKDAIAAARKNHLRVRNVDYQYSTNVKKGLVISQSIGAETEVAEDSAIDFVISLGEEEKAKNPNREVEIRLNVASDKENFNVKIFKVDKNGNKGDLLYNEYHTASDLNDNGVLVLKFMAVSGTSVDVLVDDESYGVYQVN